MNDQGVFSVRLKPDEKDLIVAAAVAEGESVGAFMRQAAARAAFRRLPGVRSIRRANGAELLWQCDHPGVSVG